LIPKHFFSVIEDQDDFDDPLGLLTVLNTADFLETNYEMMNQMIIKREEINDSYNDNEQSRAFETELSFNCDICGRKFISKSSISKHMYCHFNKAVHKCRKSFPCFYCKKSFTRQYKLGQHEKKVHPTKVSSKQKFLERMAQLKTENNYNVNEQRFECQSFEVNFKLLKFKI
jgi:hypothetical protein